jgi:hypothetical protein
MRRTNGHMEPMRGEAVQLFDSYEAAATAAEAALQSLPAGQRITLVQVLGEYVPKSGFEFVEAKP